MKLPEDFTKSKIDITNFALVGQNVLIRNHHIFKLHQRSNTRPWRFVWLSMCINGCERVVCSKWWSSQRRIQRFWKTEAVNVGHFGWSTKKVLGFRWSTKVIKTLETISFWWNISFSIFKFSLFLYQFFKTNEGFYKEREKALIQQAIRK